MTLDPLRIILALLCAGTGVSVEYAGCIIEHESSWQPDAVGAAGEIGLAQILPDTGEWLAGLAGVPWDVERLYAPVYSMTLLVTGLERDLDWLWHTEHLCRECR